MKKLSLYLALAILGFSSCQEKAPLINYSNVTAVDTTYVISPVPAADPHNVLVEEFTGANCSNCPGAKRNFLDPQIAANPGRINVIGMHIYNYPQGSPAHGGKFDFRTNAATNIGDDIYGTISIMPSAGIDRMPFNTSGIGSKYQCAASIWVNSITAQLAKTDSMNLNVTSRYDSAKNEAQIIVTTTYLQQVSTIQNLSIAIVEDEIVDFQETPTEIDTAYEFEDVFRDMVTPVPGGDKIFSTSALPNYPVKEKGRVSVKVYTYKNFNRAQWNPHHCRVIAFIHGDEASGSSGIMQSTQTPLMGL